MTQSVLHDFSVRDHDTVHIDLNVSTSAHNCGCMVDGGSAIAAI